MGKRRCLQCRTWKQKVSNNSISFLTSKCEYVDVADPCKVCREKGLRCSAADKVWGKARRLRQEAGRNSAAISDGSVSGFKEDDGIEISRVPGPPMEEALSPVDGFLLQCYMETFNVGRFWFGMPVGVDFFQIFGPTLNSMAVRYAVLLATLESDKNIYHHDRDLMTMDYNDRFYRAMRKAIAMRRYTEVLYASYFACFLNSLHLHRRQTTSSLREGFITHLKGFVSALKAVTNIRTDTEYLPADVLFDILNRLTIMALCQTVFGDSRDGWEDICSSLAAAHLALKRTSGRGLQVLNPKYRRYIDLFVRLLNNNNSGSKIIPSSFAGILLLSNI